MLLLQGRAIVGEEAGWFNRNPVRSFPFAEPRQKGYIGIWPSAANDETFLEMTDNANRALLPAGLRDVLAPDAEHEADVVANLMGHFARQGYERVKPPLIEFEDSLLDGPGAATGSQTFRIMDPLSQHMMGVRADQTPQVARIAVHRLARQPRPLRLAYAGEVLRVKGTQLRPERQFGQAGIELIGSDSPLADAEVIVLASEVLRDLGVPGVSVDLSLPPLVPALLSEMDCDRETAARLSAALYHKDSAQVAAEGGRVAAVLGELIASVGPAAEALARLSRLDLPPAAAAEYTRLARVVTLVQEQGEGVNLTVDPVEDRGFEYHTGVSFTLFGRSIGSELGRGGRYFAGGIEPATGMTLFMDSVLSALPGAKPARRLFVPAGRPRALAQAMRMQGWITVAGLDPDKDSLSEARRLGCRGVLEDNGVRMID